MNKVTSIPDNFLIELPINKEQERIFIEQINRFNELSNKKIELKSLKRDEKEKLFLPKGTMIHGISGFNLEKLESIKRTGIITGQAFGIPEDGETYYCADFYRVDKDMSMEEFNREFEFRDGRCPFGNGLRGKGTVAFIIEPTKESEELLSYDCYREGNNADITRSFTHSAGLLARKEKLSSILYGVPSNLIKGMVLGNKLLERTEIIKLMIKLFPNCYISTIDGSIIYDPINDKEYNEKVELRASNYTIRKQNEITQIELAYKKEAYTKLQKLYNSFIEQVIINCPEEEVIRLLKDNNIYQGTDKQILEYINRVKEEYREKYQRK